MWEVYVCESSELGCWKGQETAETDLLDEEEAKVAIEDDLAGQEREENGEFAHFNNDKEFGGFSSVTERTILCVIIVEGEFRKYLMN